MMQQKINIKAPNFQTIEIEIEGTSPYVQNRFSNKVENELKEKMKAGSTTRSKKERTARDFDQDCINAQYISAENWHGMPAAAFRNACIDVCRMVGFKMTHAKMSIFIEADGYDKVNATPLIKIIGKYPERLDLPVRNATGVVDIRARPVWREWSAKIRIRFDADQFTEIDIINLLSRAGQQVGIGEGRPYSKSSNGLGYGMFKIKES